MMKKFLFLLFIAGSVHAQGVFKNTSGILDSVQPDSIKRHIAYLADDKLKGRQAGTPGYQIAVDYVIAQYKQFGLQPAGENNSYLQEVRIRTAKTDRINSSIAFSNIDSPLTLGSEVALFPHFEEQVIGAKPQLVFAGYGISAPEYGYDDYKGLDVKGKVVVIIFNAPEKFESTVKAHYSHRSMLIKTAVEKGAIGIVMQSRTEADFKTASNSAILYGVNSLMNKDNKIFYPSSKGGGLGLKAFIEIPPFMLPKILGISESEALEIQNSIRQGTPRSFEMKSSVEFRSASTYKDIKSYNVVGVFPGSDPKLKNEYVLHSAHLDHLGITKPVNGDSINNGAHDNASGTSCTLEVARLYSKLKKKPKRSILFVMVTAEEMGLLGSTYFGEFPTVDKSKIVANVNMDMPTIIAPLLAVVPLGAAHSSLMNEVKTAATYLKLDVEEDPEPTENRFVRSDQYSFVRQGIPALHIKYGDKTNVPGEKLSDFVKKWRAETYHQPQDELEGGIFDFNAGKKYVQLNFLISYQIAQAKGRPTWNKDDFFGNRFGKDK